jgi:hypothetical protein
VLNVKVVTADSAAAILDDKFRPLELVASAAVLVEPPYREAQTRIAEPIFKEVEDGYEIIVREAQLCQALLETVKADVVHLDTSLGGFPIDELSPVELASMNLSGKARAHLLKILPALRRTAGEIRRKHNIEMIAIGKESVPVRIAELTAGSEAILYACARSLEEGSPVLLGLPTRCSHQIADAKIYLCSLIEAEYDVRGYATDNRGVLEKVHMTEFLNPTARGFRAIKISPKS